jgi:GntR family transcriptional regulator
LGPDQIENAPMVSTLAKISGMTIDRCEQTITISSADFEIARMLAVPLNAPIAIVERSVFDCNNVLVFENRGYYRGDLVKINMTLKEVIPGTATPGK